MMCEKHKKSKNFGFLLQMKLMEGRKLLNQDKIKIMTELAIYEDGEGKEDLKISKYYKPDYIRLEVIKAFVCSTLGYILVVGLIALYQMEYLIMNLTRLDFEAIGKYVLLIYIMISVFYIIIGRASASIKYNKSRKGISKYKASLNRLNKTYATDNIEKG